MHWMQRRLDNAMDNERGGLVVWASVWGSDLVVDRQESEIANKQIKISGNFCTKPRGTFDSFLS